MSKKDPDVQTYVNILKFHYLPKEVMNKAFPGSMDAVREAFLFLNQDKKRISPQDDLVRLLDEGMLTGEALMFLASFGFARMVIEAQAEAQQRSAPSQGTFFIPKDHPLFPKFQKFMEQFFMDEGNKGEACD